MKEISAKWAGVMVGAAAVAAFVIGLLIAGALGVFPQLGAQEKADTLRLVPGDYQSPFVAVAEEVLPAVVNISSAKKVEVGGVPFDDPFFRRFFGEFFEDVPRERTRYGLGSGVIFRPEGYILTNDHVVSGAENVTVTLADGRSFSGSKVKVVGHDPQTDLAILKIDTRKKLPVARLGDSEKLKVGEWAIAVGNPFGLEGTVTVGVISAKGRSHLPLPSAQRYQNFIQTDAAINPGNSGGPLCNIHGEVVGINTAITSPTGTSVGVGFAVPINMARYVAEEIIEKGKVERGYLGVYPQELDPQMRKSMGLDLDYGVLVADVVEGTPADAAGIRSGDVILSFDGKRVADLENFRQQVAAARPGSRAEIRLWRGGEERTVYARLAEFPEEELAGTPSPQQARPRFGLLVRTLTPKELGALDLAGGVLVREVEAASPAQDAGIQPGDVITRVGNRMVKNAEDFYSVLQTLESSGKDAALVQIYRQGRRFFVTLRLG